MVEVKRALQRVGELTGLEGTWELTAQANAAGSLGPLIRASSIQRLADPLQRRKLPCARLFFSHHILRHFSRETDDVIVLLGLAGCAVR
jgi:hypothetical protein